MCDNTQLRLPPAVLFIFKSPKALLFHHLCGMLQFDTLIVGQGIAGSLVAYQLYKREQSFRVLDAGHVNSASRVAAGMFTPVSGKRKTISKDYFTQATLAIETYMEIALLLDKKILHVENVHHLFDSEAEKKLLADKTLLPEYRNIFITESLPSNGIKNGESGIVIKHSGWVDCPLFIECFRQWLHDSKLLIAALFDYAILKLTDQFFQYNDMQFRNIVFCEGYRVTANPFFDKNVIPCKGDIISIAVDDNSTNGIIKKNAFYMLPAKNGTRKVGATFKWHNGDEALYENDRQQLEQAATSMLACGHIKTLQHHSAIRATTPGQHVIAKAHPSIKNMFMLNGLGTKGILLGPVYAAQLVQAIVNL